MLIIYIIIILSLFIYNVSGVYLIIPFRLALLNYIISSINLLAQPTNVKLRLIQLISLTFMIIILGLNIK